MICSDKTGTLTMNQMTVRGLWVAGQRYRVSGEGYRPDGEIASEVPAEPRVDLAPLLRSVVLCNDSRVTDGVVIGDPTEGALVTLALKARLEVDSLRAQLPRVAEVPFDSDRRYMATFHREGDAVRIFVKGAPGVLLERSGASSRPDGARSLDDGSRQGISDENDRLAAGGLRVLAVATRELRAADFDPKQELTTLVTDLTFVGLVGMMDPPRAEAREAIELCKSAGICRQDDHRRPARHRRCHRPGPGPGRATRVTGAELDRMDDATLAAVLPDVAVFARVAPEHKLRIVAALQARRARRGDDRRRRQRRSGSSEGRHRRGDGRRDRGREGGRQHGPHRRQLRDHRPGGARRPDHLRQHREVRPLSALDEHGRAADRLRGAVPGAASRRSARPRSSGWP